MQNICIHMLIYDTQTKNFIIFDVMNIKIHLAWVANSMVIFSASYNDRRRDAITKNIDCDNTDATNPLQWQTEERHHYRKY